MISITLDKVTKEYLVAELPQAVPGGGFLARVSRAVGLSRAPAPVVVEEEAPRTVTALDGVSLTVRPGETMAIIGPSGCGKTTLLRVIAGLERPDSGRVFYNDTDVTRMEPGRRGIGLVFQNYALYPHMDGKDNLAFYFRVHRREEEIEERVRRTSELLGVGFKELLDKKPPTMSSGQQQRVAIGRCIVRDPSVFLFDEPLSNVDARLREQTRVQLKRLLNHFTVTSVYVTHDQTEAVALGDRLAVMNEGRILQVGTYAELTRLPRNKFVAGFVGLQPMSFLVGVLDSEGLRTDDGTRIPLPPHLRDLAPQGKRLALGFRANEVSLSAPVGGEGLLGIVQTAEAIPSEPGWLVEFSLAGMLCRALAPRELRPRPGHVVRLDLPEAESLYLFDEETGRTLWPR
jgi:ABC-type sugar transport system ATPase subunit